MLLRVKAHLLTLANMKNCYKDIIINKIMLIYLI